MSKNRDSSQRSARALKRLEAHNECPKDIVESEESDGNQNQPREDSSHRRSGSRSRHRSMEVEERSRSRSQASSRHEHSKSRRRKDSHSRSYERSRHERSRSQHFRSSSRQSEPPAWAREILEQQRQNTEELRRLKSGLAEKSMSQSASNAFNQASSTQPEFRFEGNKQQHEVNRSVIGYLDRALDSKDQGGDPA